MLPVCIFHGLNNTGKSNILSAIETIFRRKLIVEGTTYTELTTVDDVTKPEQVTKQLERVGSFWQGRIIGFRDNFYLNGKNDITFSVTVCFADDELKFLEDILKSLHKSLAQGQHQKALTLTGRIKYLDDSSADMVLERAVFNEKYVVFEVDRGGKKCFFPKLKEFGAEDRLGYFDKLMDLLADAFALLPSDRYLTRERMAKKPTVELPLTPKDFKKWLFKLSLSRSDYKAFEEIKTMFASDPFSFGDIGFSSEGDEIEVMVKEKNVRLPISRLGSGNQQILYIIANLVLNKKKMMGIEELEINLSPTAQKIVFEKLKRHIYKGSDLISQIIITSHSDYFEGRTDVRRYSVKHDGNETIVEPLTEATWKGFFPPTGKKLPL
jgi:predicted ATPase